MAFLPEVRDFATLVAVGSVPGYSNLIKFGYNADVDTGTAPEGVWDAGGPYTGFPTQVETVQVFSSSALDTAAGTGARTITIQGLNAAGVSATETLTLNGLTPVTSATVWSRVNRASCKTAGALGANQGVITCRHTVTVANVFFAMPIGFNQNQVAAYTIPAGFTAQLKAIHAAMSQGTTPASALVGLFLRNPGELFQCRRVQQIVAGQQMELDTFGSIKLPALTDIEIRVISVSNNNTAVSAGFDLLIIQDGL